MRRTGSSRFSLFNYDNHASGERLTASFEDALKSTLSDDWKVESVSYKRNSNDAWNSLQFKIANLTHNSTLKCDYSSKEYMSIENVAKALNLDITLHAIAIAHPELKIIRGNILKKSITLELKSGCFHTDLKELSACYNTDTGDFFPQMLAKLAGLDIDPNSLPEIIPSPGMLNAEHIELGSDPRNVLYPDLDPGYGNAVYITGEGPLLGNWETATRLNHVQGRWRWTPPAGVTVTEGKFLTGPFIKDQKQMSVSALQYENIAGNRHIELTLLSP